MSANPRITLHCVLTSFQKSREKNTQLEDQWRRNEISMRRKQQTANPLSPSALSSDSDAPKSPASTGAMDDLLQKLRAAKPEARDQRDRRRRARLKDKHQVRVASGQKIPELGVNVEDEGVSGDESAKKDIVSPTSDVTDTDAPAPDPSNTDVDIADRAAAMLEGLQGGSSLNKDGSLSVRRRRESADTERQRRRNRRQQASGKTEDGSEGVLSPTTIPEGEEEGDTQGDVEVVISPPSPERGSEKDEGRLPTPPPE
jgi:cytokinesis protein